jgi:uncharacterized protein YbjT (DUF2867 family)
MKLIVGATGMLGVEICRHLRAAGHPVRAVVLDGASLGRGGLDRLLRSLQDSLPVAEGGRP